MSSTDPRQQDTIVRLEPAGAEDHVDDGNIKGNGEVVLHTSSEDITIKVPQTVAIRLGDPVVEIPQKKAKKNKVVLDLDDSADEHSATDDYNSDEEFLDMRRNKASVWSRQANRYHWVLEDRLKFLEKRLLSLTAEDIREKKGNSATKTVQQNQDSHVKVLTWQEYCIDKGRDKPEDAATVDVLLEEAVPFNPHGKISKADIKRPPAKTEQELIDIARDFNRLPERIRINSRSIQELLRELARSDDIATVSDVSSMVFIKPYKMLYTLEPAIRNALDEAETALLRLEEAERISEPPMENKNEGSGKLQASSEAEDLRCIIQVIDVFLKPIKLRLLPDAHPETVRFEELWLLFKPGCLVVTDERYVTQKIWKVVQKRGGRRYLRSRERGDDDDDSDVSGDFADTSVFILDCIYIDYDGDRLGAVPKRFTIGSFEGRQPIHSLNIFPLVNTTPEFEETKQKLMEIGERFLDCTKVQHRAYSGKTLKRQPGGWSLASSPSRAELSANIESAVVIDFNLTFQYQVEWAPFFVTGNFSQDNAREWQEVPRAYDRMKPETDNHQRIRPDNIIRDFEWDQRERLSVLASIEADKRRWERGEKPRGDELLLLPDRVFGFILRSRSWAPFKLDLLKKITADQDGLQDLQLPKGYREVIQSLIEWQFSKNSGMDMQADPEFDVVRSKGRGLVVLLHGAPGLGKTSTAECIANANSKPLLSITCGALGETAGEVEMGLQNLFRLAQAWDCVLLLDEADVFLAERTLQDMQRNGIISVFLRTLEYYEGILFLTTNRVGELDEAFRSRIHIALYYPALDWDRTYKVWEMQLRRLHTTFPDLRCDDRLILEYGTRLFSIQNSKKAGTGWNGRQIRNAFQSAMALCKYRSSRNHGVTPELRVEDFEEVTTAANEFDEYLFRTRGRYEPDRAKFNQLRAGERPFGSGHNGLGPGVGGYSSSFYPTTPEFRPRTTSGGTYEESLRGPNSGFLSPQTAPSQMGTSSYGSPGMNNARYQGRNDIGQQQAAGYGQTPIQSQLFPQPQFGQGMMSGSFVPNLTPQSSMNSAGRESQGYHTTQQQQEEPHYVAGIAGVMGDSHIQQHGFESHNSMGQGGQMIPHQQNDQMMGHVQSGTSQMHVSGQFNVD